MVHELVGKKFHRLTIISIFKGTDSRKRYCAKVKCDCGKLKDVRLENLKSGHVKSCGCYNSEQSKKRAFRHGLSSHPLYIIWRAIKSRCFDPNVKTYKNYGGRGIGMSKKWIDSFYAFYTWAKNNGWAKGLQIDRENNNKGYYPYNCRFVTRTQNARNRSNNSFIIYNGLRRTISEWAEILNISQSVIWQRLVKLKWSPDRCFSTPVKQIKRK